MEQSILLQRDRGIATVILNRPEKLNALTRPMSERPGDTFEELSADDTVRCIAIGGEVETRIQRHVKNMGRG
jgi:enoyl-CoA hydratase/carnithine racemase